MSQLQRFNIQNFHFSLCDVFTLGPIKYKKSSAEFQLFCNSSFVFPNHCACDTSHHAMKTTWRAQTVFSQLKDLNLRKKFTLVFQIY